MLNKLYSKKGLLFFAIIIAVAVWILYSIIANTAKSATAWNRTTPSAAAIRKAAAPSAILPLPGPSSPASVLSIKLRRDQPDPRFKGQLVDIVSVTVRNYGDTRQVSFNFSEYYGQKQAGAPMAIVMATPGLRTLSDKTPMWWLPLKQNRTRTVRFYVRSTPDQGMYCIGNTDPQIFCVS